VLVAPTLETARPVWLADPVNRNHPLNQGRVAWWLALQGIDGGKFFYDLMGLVHGTLTAGVSWSGSARPGGWRHLSLDGTNGHYVSLPTAASLNITPNITVAAWIRTTGTSGHIYGGYKNSSPFNGMGLGMGFAGNGAQVSVWTGGASWIDDGGAGLRINDGKWHRVGCVVKGASETSFVDGVGFVLGSLGNSIPSYSGVRGIGGRAVDGDSPFPGDLDGLSVWNRALSAAEMRADYDSSRIGDPGVLNRMGPAAFGVPATTVHPWWQYCGPMMGGNGGGV
jgi:hypothetical protein